MLFVFAVIVAALVLFATEALPVDVTAIAVMVALMLAEPVTVLATDLGLLAEPVYVLHQAGDGISPLDRGLSGFASTATITVLAMFILSDGVQRTGIVQILGAKIASLTGDSETRQLSATVGLVAPISGFINNTAAVAILLPMVTDIAHKGKLSPSKLLLPLSYASMFGGMLTLIGTSTNILASQLSAELLGRPFSMFEFTQLGIIVTIVGTIYLLTVGRYLVPSRIPAEEDLTEEFEMGEYLTEVVVREDSPLIGQTVEEALRVSEFDVDIVQLVREKRTFLEPFGQKTIRAGDVFAIRTGRDTLVDLLDVEGLDVIPEVEVGEAELEAANERKNLVEVVVAPGSSLIGETLVSTSFRQRYDATVLALRHGQELYRQRMDHVKLRIGDTLLVQATPDSIDRLNRNNDFIVAQEVERPDFRRSKIPVAVGIVAAVVGVAALTPIHIVISALGGALAMVLTGCLRPSELYDAVQWDVVFLLAGVIPLGVALQETGGADLLAELFVMGAGSVLTAGGGLAVVLGLMYLVTALLTNIISNNASVVLMIPVAIETAQQLNANAFAFVLAVTFAASTAFMTPVGYQTNLLVYGPGGYRFTDYLRVGAPLQAVFAVVTTLGIAYFWGLAPA
ncbi:potassium transporter TrkA [Haloarcula hispanica N601]|uniref:Potassium transporter TrkA n=2 Tax=Haloarcula hispanica TaxID=51589 RepID=V5TGW2_HALHI|nr:MULTISPECIES: SLC13 family permease [Haloarcula]AEM55680.1 sodium/sulfate symporter family transporter [Haloarcula hispanica ATCC 33960]AHB64511.1 potassium transporter TrkA [Haloarcula hispanica N601]AJF25707.1 potassium transporter TrkA [Haloarcula sp. CBA1115]KAA9405661.1 SLC13 family permease [Haloarcula sp. CBA1131]MUV49131.1 SLC13 family permease [Haloarcula sp. CBA1122]